MSEVGLTETVHSGKGSDARKFELWLQGKVTGTTATKALLITIRLNERIFFCVCVENIVGRHEVWVLQAPARDVKETWITEIKRVLLNQFHQLKGQQTSRPSPSTNLVAPAGGVQKTIQHSSSIPNGTTHPSSPYGPKYIGQLISFTRTDQMVAGGQVDRFSDRYLIRGFPADVVLCLFLLRLKRSLRPTSSCSSWEYNSSTAGSSSSSGVSSAGDRSSIVETSASSTTSRASSSSRMLRSTTVDEDDGWSTDFSLSDEDMGETYLDHVEVRSLSPCIIEYWMSLTSRFYSDSLFGEDTSYWPIMLHWDRLKLVFEKEILSISSVWVALDGGMSVRLQVGSKKISL